MLHRLEGTPPLLITTPLWRRWTMPLSLVFFIGAILRLIYVNDMEYKEDEVYNFDQTQLLGVSQPWPWVGIPSGVYLVNPGMSIWVFAILAKIFGIHSPTGLAQALQCFALFGMALIIPFVFRFLSNVIEQEQWLWAFLLAMVNPFLVCYQRKLWPESFLPCFTMLVWMGWWKRETRWGAFVWGLIGAWLGQIHMSGFFLAGALWIWTLLFKRKSVAWKAWFLGSVLGALPLIPWLHYMIQHPVDHAVSVGWEEMVQFKYWVFWITDGVGLHLGNTLGVLRGNSHWHQISDFIRYPLIKGQATYLTGVAHVLAFVSGGGILLRGLAEVWTSWHRRGERPVGVQLNNSTDTAFILNAVFLGCGILLTLTGIWIRRYYLCVTFPLEMLFMVRMARPETQSGKVLLSVLWVAQLIISTSFVGYIHVNEGSIQGDYGKAYHLIK